MRVRVTSDALDDVQIGYDFYEKQEEGLAPTIVSARSRIWKTCARPLAFTVKSVAIWT